MKPAKKKKPGKDYQALYRECLKDIDALTEEITALRQELEQAEERYKRLVPDTYRLMDENRALADDFAAYRGKLASLLTPEQAEAARISWCAPDVYAMNLIRLCQRKIEEISSLTGSY